MDLISIVVPVYNVSRYLDECVKSLINQTYSNIEIILVNDGSTDRSGEICDELKKIDNRVKVVHKKNEGLGFARNTGLEYVRGKYVTFIDSDDYADNDLIENLYYAIKKNKADTCIGGFKRVDDLGNVLYKETYVSRVYNNNECISELLLHMLGSSPEKSDAIRMSVWNVLYSSDIIKTHDLKFPSERVYISEDLIFDLDYYQYSKKCILIESISYNYRVNQNSLTQTYKKDKFEKYEFLYNEVYKKIMNDNLPNEFIIRLQRQFFVNLREGIKQETLNNKKEIIKNRVNNIRNIITGDTVREILESYPINRLPIKQRVFLYLVKYKLSYLLFFSAVLRIY